MANDVVDNQSERLSQRMCALLNGATSAHFAVGYLFLDGLAPLRARIAQLKTVEILIGNVVNRLTQEQVREEADTHVRGGEEWVRDQEDVAATLRASRDQSAAITAVNLRRTLADLDHTPEMRALVLTLAGRIADGGLKVRLYTQGRIHAKLALIKYPMRRVEGQPFADTAQLAVVGSSNLTLGAPAHPTELNVIVRDPDSLIALNRWYHGLWDTGQDFHRELFDELAQSWALNEDRPD